MLHLPPAGERRQMRQGEILGERLKDRVSTGIPNDVAMRWTCSSPNAARSWSAVIGRLSLFLSSQGRYLAREPCRPEFGKDEVCIPSAPSTPSSNWRHCRRSAFPTRALECVRPALVFTYKVEMPGITPGAMPRTTGAASKNYALTFRKVRERSRRGATNAFRREGGRERVGYAVPKSRRVRRSPSAHREDAREFSGSDTQCGGENSSLLSRQR